MDGASLSMGSYSVSLGYVDLTKEIGICEPLGLYGYVMRALVCPTNYSFEELGMEMNAYIIKSSGENITEKQQFVDYKNVRCAVWTDTRSV